MANEIKSAGPRFSVFGPNGKLLGKGSHGARHWWTQRVLTVCGFPLVVISILIVACGTGGGPEKMLYVLSRPWATIIIGLTSFLMIAHMRLGVHQILEDYVPSKKARYTTFILNDAFCAVVALLVAYAMFKLATLSTLSGLVHGSL